MKTQYTIKTNRFYKAEQVPVAEGCWVCLGWCSGAGHKCTGAAAGAFPWGAVFAAHLALAGVTPRDTVAIRSGQLARCCHSPSRILSKYCLILLAASREERRVQVWSQALEDQGLAHAGVFEAPTWHVHTSPITQGKMKLEFSLPHINRNSSSEGRCFSICARDNWNWK